MSKDHATLASACPTGVDIVGGSVRFIPKPLPSAPLSAHAVQEVLSHRSITVERASRPPILNCVVDAANVLTLLGLMCSGAAIFFAVREAFHLAGFFMIGAYLADLFDGPIARSTKSRSPGLSRIGANLDSLADLVGCGVCPGVVLMMYSATHPWLLSGSLALLVAAAIRLAYFNVYGLDDSGGYTGIPTDFIILFFAGLLLLEGILPHFAYVAVLFLGAFGASAMMVSSVRIPKLSGKWHYRLPALALVIAFSHALHFVHS